MSEDKSDAEDNAQQLDFESALKELESLVEALESGDLTLADSLEQFKRGIGLSKRCHSLLDEARQSVEMLSSPDNEDSAEEFGGTQ